MKTKLLSFAATLALVSYSASSIAGIRHVVINPSDLHVPKGFDANDNVEVMLTGDLPDTCHLRPTGKVKVTGNKISISMTASKVESKDTNCIMALVPYMVSVPIGQLPEGQYTIVVNPKSQNKTSRPLKIDRPSSGSIDNFTYANVTSISKTADGSTLILEGAHPSSCMSLDRIEIIPNEINDTYAVLPIVKQTKTICDYLMTPFVYEVPVSPEKNKVVYHVRKIDGTALNYRLDK